jgi:hypothetical protein
MLLTRSTRDALSSISFGLGSVWAVAGAFKLLFGVRVTFPLLPPIDLSRVSPVPALGIAFGFFVASAWLSRRAVRGDAAPKSKGVASADSPMFLSNPAPIPPPSKKRTVTPIGIRPPSP